MSDKTVKIQMSETQQLSLELLNDPQIVELLFGGGAGGAKTFMVCLWMAMQCRDYPGITIGLGRKELTRLKQTTVKTLFAKVHPILGIKKGEFKYQDQKGLIEYINGSQIQLLDLARQPSDPDFDTFGSLELTHVVIEEVGEVTKKAVDVLGSRKNRMLNDRYGIIGKTVMTCNPTQNFIRQQYYEPYKKLGMGRMQKWVFGEVILPSGERLESFRAFVRSLVTDNPFADRNYIETLKNLPPQERKRLLEGNWDYADDDDMLFKSLLLDRATISDIEPSDKPFKTIGVDVADKGKDKTIVSLMVDGVITEQKRLNVDTTGEKPISELYALELIKFAQQRGFTSAQARQIAIEGNGVGVGMRDFMRSKGWMITVYEATSISRSKGYYDFYLDLDSGSARIHSQLETMADLRKQLMAITYEMNDKLEPVILQKKKIKEVIGHSPDEADSAMISNWIRRGGHVDPKKDPSRIIF